MKRRMVLSRFACFAVSALLVAGAAPHPRAIAAEYSRDDIWQGVGSTRIDGVETEVGVFLLDTAALERRLNDAPRERVVPLEQSPTTLTLPMPDGSLWRFRIEASPVFEPALEAQYPDIRSFRARGIDRTTASARFDWTPHGFHALILAEGLAVSVHPRTRERGTDYVSYAMSDARKRFECGVVDVMELDGLDPRDLTAATGDLLRTYRIAISTTGEFTQDVGGGSVAGALAELNTLLNGINAIYERDLSVHLDLIAGLEPVIFTDPATDPYTNGDTNAMIDEVSATLGANLADASYDVGHVVGTDSGGLARVGAVCDDTTANGGPAKSQGVSGAGVPVTNSVDLMAHELGHQFGAPHSQNSNCNRSPLNAIETGSGVTIMSYNGVCDPNNTVPIAESRFHSWSLAIMNAYIDTQTCQQSTATGNAVPTIDAGIDRTIPVNTPFTLTATGGDNDAGDVPNLTYTWEQIDPGQLNGGATDYPNPPYQDQPGDPTTTTRPILTAVVSSPSPARTFPRLTYILNNANDPPDQVDGLFTAEELPRVGRSLNFRATIRDGRGGTNTDDLTVTVAGGAGPFGVSGPNGGESWTVGTMETVTWNVNGTDAAPVSCANVMILLSADGGQTYPFVLAASTPNDGTENITVPNALNTATARVKVEAVGNVFFDVSDADFTINAGAGCPFVTSVLPGAGTVGDLITLNGTGFTNVTNVQFANAVTAVFNVVDDTQITATVPAGAVTGPITLSKTGCPDVPTADFTVCPNAALVAQVDDGGGETNWSGTYFVNRLTPTAYPATLSQVLIQLNAANVPENTPITVLFGANPGGTADISGVTVNTIAGTAGPGGAFKAFSVPLLTIHSGDFVVGFGAPGDFPGFADTTTPQGRSYESSTLVFSGGPGFQNHNMLVRASYFTDCGAPLPCPSVTGINPMSGPIGSNVVITGNNFTGVTGVSFNGQVATFNVDSNVQITATVPGGATSGPITISKTDCPDVQTTSFTVSDCAITALGVGTQTACDPGTNTYTQEVVVTFNDAPGAGTLDVNGQSFAIGASPQTVTLTGLPADGQPVNVTASFSALSDCALTQNTLFTAPADCSPGVNTCVTPNTAIPDNDPNGITSDINVVSDLAITSVEVTVNIPHTYIGDLIVELQHAGTTVRLHNQTGDGAQNIVGTYPTTLTVDGPGTLADFNGQSSAGTWTLFVSDNAGVDTGTLVEWCLNIEGTPNTTCAISDLAAGTQTPCNPATNTYTQEVIVTFANAPGSGTLDVHGQSFAIGTSPQTVVLTGLTADGNPVDVSAAFSADAGCTRMESALFTAPVSCAGPADIAVAPTSFDVTLAPDDSTTQTLTIRNVGTAGSENLTWDLQVGTGGGALALKLQDGRELPAAFEPREQRIRSVDKRSLDAAASASSPASGTRAKNRRRPVLAGAGGPDAFGYTWIDSDEAGGPTFAWQDITGVGTESTFLSGADEAIETITLPFTFPFYGVDKTSISMVTNGYLTFETGVASVDFDNVAIPTGTLPNDLIAPFWEDLDPGSGGTVHYYHNAGTSEFIVQYTNVVHYLGVLPNTFQVILRPNGSIRFQYLDMQDVVNSATVGIENADASVGLQVAFDQTYIHDGLAVLIQPPGLNDDCAWLRATPTNGDVAPGDSVQVAVTIDATGLVDGVYACELRINSNDPDTAQLVVPVNLTVQPPTSDTTPIPRTHRLHANVPNPFNPRTIIRYDLPQASLVSLHIYDARGRLVRTLESGKPRGPGSYDVVWDGRSDAGEQQSSGVYFYRLDADAFVATRRMTLLK